MCFVAWAAILYSVHVVAHREPHASGAMRQWLGTLWSGAHDGRRRVILTQWYVYMDVSPSAGCEIVRNICIPMSFG